MNLFFCPLPPHQCPSVSPLSAFQLSVVLFSLCHGLSQASRRYLTPAPTIRLWIQQQEHHLSEKMWCWRTDKLAEWVLSQREQQLSVSEDTLLKTARGALGVDSKPVDCYRWTVDFLLRHELSMWSIHMDNIQHPRRLPRNIRDNSRAFIDLLSAQVRHDVSQQNLYNSKSLEQKWKFSCDLISVTAECLQQVKVIDQ